jgi:pantoate--beta-alanine ligase
VEKKATIRSTREWLASKSRADRRVGLVPTMGALHEGHRALIRACRQKSDVAVVSIFVNPAQFGPSEDYARYPSTLEKDLELCRAEGVDLVFAPEAQEMYPKGFTTKVRVEGLSEKLCGAFRPGHFDGVATVVLKLFEIASPNLALFGEKDFQQFVVLQRMVKDLNLPVALEALETVREKDGLALSSRNAYLAPQERHLAMGIFIALQAGRACFEHGTKDPDVLVALVRNALLESGIETLDYVSLIEPETLETPNQAYPGCRMMVAARIGRTRLIDNVRL